MNKALITIALTVLVTISIAGQTDRYSLLPNFSGVWVPERPLTGDISDLVWEINHKGVEVKIKKTFRYKGEVKTNLFTVYTDYRRQAEIDAVLDENAPTKVITQRELKKGKAGRQTELRLNDGESRFYWIATFDLSPDGTRLTIKSNKYRKPGTNADAQIELSEAEVLVRKN